MTRKALTVFVGSSECVCQENIEDMQAVLDTYLDGYSHRQTHQGCGMNGRTPTQATQGLPTRHRAMGG